MLEQAHERSIEGFVAGPKPRKWQDTLPPNLLHNSALGEYDAENVSIGRKCHEDRHYALGLVSEHIPEENRRDDPTRTHDLGLGNCCKVGDVAKHVQNRDENQSCRCSSFQDFYWVFCFRKCVVGIAVADETPDNIVECSDDSLFHEISIDMLELKPWRLGNCIGEVISLSLQEHDASSDGCSRANDTSTASSVLQLEIQRTLNTHICTSCCSFESVGKVMWLLDAKVSSKRGESGADNQKQNKQLDRTQYVLQTETPIESTPMNEKSTGDTSKTQSSLIPSA